MQTFFQKKNKFLAPIYKLPNNTCDIPETHYIQVISYAEYVCAICFQIHQPHLSNSHLENPKKFSNFAKIQKLKVLDLNFRKIFFDVFRYGNMTQNPILMLDIQCIHALHTILQYISQSIIAPRYSLRIKKGIFSKISFFHQKHCYSSQPTYCKIIIVAHIACNTSNRSIFIYQTTSNQQNLYPKTHIFDPLFPNTKFHSMTLPKLIHDIHRFKPRQIQNLQALYNNSIALKTNEIHQEASLKRMCKVNCQQQSKLCKFSQILFFLERKSIFTLKARSATHALFARYAL